MGTPTPGVTPPDAALSSGSSGTGGVASAAGLSMQQNERNDLTYNQVIAQWPVLPPGGWIDLSLLGFTRDRWAR